VKYEYQKPFFGSNSASNEWIKPELQTTDNKLIQYDSTSIYPSVIGDIMNTEPMKSYLWETRVKTDRERWYEYGVKYAEEE